MRPKISFQTNPIEQAILGAMLMLIFCGGVALVTIKIFAKINLCQTYYSEMNSTMCFFSDLTLPQGKNR